MKKVIFTPVLFHMFLSACDPAYEYSIAVEKSDVMLEIHPTLESVYCPDLKDICEFSRNHAVKKIEDGAIYQIKRGEKFSVYGGAGTKASSNLFPFKFMKVIQGKDTIVLQDKNQILDKFIKVKNTNKYQFSL